MFRTAFASALMLSLMFFGGAQSAQAQSTPNATQLASSYVDALEAGQWEKAHAMTTGFEGGPQQQQASWTRWTKDRGSDANWRGVAVEELSQGSSAQVFFPLLRTDGQVGIAVTVDAGSVVGWRMRPSYVMYGPYAFLTGRAHVWPEGSVTRWYIAPSGKGVVTEVRGPNGLIDRVDIIKASSPGTLVMLRSSSCPDNVCGQTGTLQDGVVSWKEPKASGGHMGNFMDAKLWMEGNELVTYTIDPAPAGGIQIYDQFPEFAHLRPKPERIKLISIPSRTVEQLAEANAKVSQLEPLVESQVAQILSAQLSKAQSIANAQAAKQRSSERTQRFNNAMFAMNGALSAANEVATANEAQSRAELNATLAQMNAQAAVQRQAQNSSPPAGQQGVQQSQQVGASAASASPSNAGGTTARAGTLEVESVAKPPSADSKPSDPNAVRQMLLACFLVHHGDFDQGKGAVFFSSTVPVTVERGQPVGGDPTGTFRRKVKSSYNINGGAGCQTFNEAAEAQRYMQDVGTSHRGHKKIDTGMSPLD